MVKITEIDETKRNERQKTPGIEYKDVMDSYGNPTGAYKIIMWTPISAFPRILIQNMKNLTLQNFCNLGKGLLSTGLYILKQILKTYIAIVDVLIPASAPLAPSLSNLMVYVAYKAYWKLNLDIHSAVSKDLLLTNIADNLYQSATIIAQMGAAFLGETTGTALASSVATGAVFPAAAFPAAGAIIGSLAVYKAAPVAKPVIGKYTNKIINAAKNQLDYTLDRIYSFDI
jgi:hypothetical protein